MHTERVSTPSAFSVRSTSNRRPALIAILALALAVTGWILTAGAAGAGTGAQAPDLAGVDGPPSGDFLVYLPLANSCQNLYFDDFGNPNSGWPADDVGSVLFQYLGGEYRLLMRNTNWWAGSTPGFDFTSYLLQASVRNPTAKDGSYGLLFGRKTGWVGFYTFEVGPDGSYVIWRYNGNGSWTPLDFGSSAAIKGGSASNLLAVERNGIGIRAWVNGVLLIDLNDGAHTGGLDVGVTATSFGEANLDVRFDNYTVLPIGCGLSSGEQLQLPTTGNPAVDLPDSSVIDAPMQR